MAIDGRDINFDTKFSNHPKTGVSNSNPPKGRISYQKCSVGCPLKEKWFWGLQFLEEGSQGPNMLSNMTVFLHFYGFINNIFVKTAKKFQHFNKTRHNLDSSRGTRAA